VGDYGLYLSGLGSRPVAGSYEHGSEPSSSAQNGEFIGNRRGYQPERNACIFSVRVLKICLFIYLFIYLL
jgi:hypothetical protein